GSFADAHFYCNWAGTNAYRKDALQTPSSRPRRAASHWIARTLVILRCRPALPLSAGGMGDLAPHRACAWATPGCSKCTYPRRRLCGPDHHTIRGLICTDSLLLQVGRHQGLPQGCPADTKLPASPCRFPLDRKNPC